MAVKLLFGALMTVAVLSGGSRAYALGTCPDDSSGTCLRGLASQTYQTDSNQCVPDVVRQFDSLKDHGEIMGFRDGGARINYPPLDNDFDHLQGVQRLAFPASNRILMALASSHGSGGHYAVVSLGTRGVGGFTGRRFGGNRMKDTTQDWNVVPQANDTIVQNGRTNRSTTYTHPSGIQSLGQYLAVPLELIGGGGPPGRTELFDTGVNIDFNVTQCTGTKPGCFQSKWVFEHTQSGAGEDALARLDDGRYLMLTAIATDTSKLEVNVSQYNDGVSTIANPDVFGAWNSPGHGGASSAIFRMDKLPVWKPYQSLQLVTECGSGHLYLVGAEKRGNGDDFADLYRLNLAVTGSDNIENEPLVSTASIATAFTLIRSKHFWCTYEGSPRQCDFDAASGVYVDPFGTLLLYATVHDDSGPKAGVIRFVEFAPNDPVDRPDTPAVESCDSTDNMWVEFSNRTLTANNLPPIGAERFFIERHNELRSDTSFETAYSFNDEALSIRYCLPPGFRYKVCSDTSFKGACQFFCGDSVSGCSGLISNGQVRGANFAKPTASSGCFTTNASPNCAAAAPGRRSSRR
jgi:hypothetical protein